MKALAILGASGHGKVVADAALEAGWNKILFFDDAWPEITSISIWPVIGNTETLIGGLLHFDNIVIAIGNNLIRYEKMLKIQQANLPLATIVHPNTTISRFTNIGEGSVILAGAVINCDSVLGSSCIVNTRSTIDHDCILGHAVHISPGANLAGCVTVGDLSWIGIGASVRQQIKIGRQVIIGAGAAVIREVADNATLVGVPGKELKR